ncbi:hypothetical protein Achl_4356 (plasmid) [Pseudarthrobacter chlorophenolicus A6]|uniref:Uncharacterized protein n=1 Tax=Pseudarthrobacter chlorophenolicus (strain ATCC 700700 / DSM 12829 / CIP 107037 / JCM 12360 / KCTC 9906 / NCIMB 13794 / A6) TaxID=452863 RepID=B8HIR0_PSECP|nr:hypothetical protein [Pseudarthrobacter chlorophenolicus]ACL42307.1 hypothetical protein Achl_4356 [Pseudarthrobacter chlorophenolicus A6]SDQ16281.1 hypothetical protein SAMN04489738_0413 [Pseudarthrobacter chlorophenolicus]
MSGRRPKLFQTIYAEPPKDVIRRFYGDPSEPRVWEVYVRAANRKEAMSTLRSFGQTDTSPGDLRTPSGTRVLANQLTGALDRAGVPAVGELVYAPRLSAGPLVLARLVDGPPEHSVIGHWPDNLDFPAA